MCLVDRWLLSSNLQGPEVSSAAVAVLQVHNLELHAANHHCLCRSLVTLLQLARPEAPSTAHASYTCVLCTFNFVHNYTGRVSDVFFHHCGDRGTQPGVQFCCALHLLLLPHTCVVEHAREHSVPTPLCEAWGEACVGPCPTPPPCPPVSLCALGCCAGVGKCITDSLH